MLLYLGLCSIQRPLDDKTQVRVAFEAEAVLRIIEWCETGQADLIVSAPLRFESERNPHPVRKSHALNVLGKAARSIDLSDDIINRAGDFGRAGMKFLDALHVA